MPSIKLHESDNGPGFGLLKIVGWTHSATTSAMAIMRNQGNHYLGTDGQWSATEVWHPLTGMSSDAEALVGEVGPLVIDPLSSIGGARYMAILRAGSGAKDQSALQIDPNILGSNARGVGAPPISVTGTGFIVKRDSALLGSADSDVGGEKYQRAGHTSEGGGEHGRDDPRQGVEPGPGHKPVRWWLWLLLLAVAVLVVASVLVWRMDLGVSKEANRATGPCDVAKMADQPELDFVRDCLATSPSNKDIVGVAEAAMGTEHCDVARRLFVHVAQGGDADAALIYARMFDPDTSGDRRCVESDPDTAAYWYKVPADTGNVEAQRQLGKLLLQLHASGFEREQGIKYLKAAAEAGDGDAKAQVEKLDAVP